MPLRRGAKTYLEVAHFFTVKTTVSRGRAVSGLRRNAVHIFFLIFGRRLAPNL